MSKDFSFKDVSEHTTKKDLWLVIHDKVYDTTKFVDEHPGGEEVLLDVGGQDATEAFEDVGHSDEAREVLDGLLLGSLKRGPGDPAPPKGATEKVAAGPKPTSSDTGSGVMLYAALVLGAAIVYGTYTYMQNSDSK